VWAGYSAHDATLSFFFTLHFLLAFVILALIALHIYALHVTGSSNRIGGYTGHVKVRITFHYAIDALNALLLTA